MKVKEPQEVRQGGELPRQTRRFRWKGTLATMRITYLVGSSLVQSVLDSGDNRVVSISVVNDGIAFASCNEPLYKGLASSCNSDDWAIRNRGFSNCFIWNVSGGNAQGKYWMLDSWASLMA